MGREADRGRAEALEAGGRPILTSVLSGREALGAEMLRWEIATAAACSVLNVNPFDQPDVESAKRRAREALERTGEGAAARQVDPDPDAIAALVREWLPPTPEGKYVALQAFLDPAPGRQALLDGTRKVLGQAGWTTTAGFGPRYLHSTGQLHKGGPEGGWFVQLTDRPVDLEIPDGGGSFARLIAAQAAGDAEALEESGRSVLRLELAS
ncbi:MAG: hypothetical protein R2991_09685 [Thermoanaerobaculia bacterium]